MLQLLWIFSIYRNDITVSFSLFSLQCFVIRALQSSAHLWQVLLLSKILGLSCLVVLLAFL